MAGNALYQNRDQTISVIVYDTDGTTILPSTEFANAIYRVYDKDENTVVVTKTLGNGITQDGNRFLVTLSDTDITVSGVYKHTFVVGSIAGELLPSVFDDYVDIIPGVSLV